MFSFLKMFRSNSVPRFIYFLEKIRAKIYIKLARKQNNNLQCLYNIIKSKLWIIKKLKVLSWSTWSSILHNFSEEVLFSFKVCIILLYTYRRICQSFISIIHDQLRVIYTYIPFLADTVRFFETNNTYDIIWYIYYVMHSSLFLICYEFHKFASVSRARF